MSRLSAELDRLYRPAGAEGAGETLQPSALADEQGRVRALVLELARPADWRPLAAVWRGVQAELGLPAPAVAVNGVDGLQLWFSLAEPLEPARAQAFLDGLCRRYLAGLPPARLARWPAAAGSPTWTPQPLPAEHGSDGCWSAFVAPDLAPLFAETPWLDISPGGEGQADLLARTARILPADLEAAEAQLQAAAAAAETSALAAARDAAAPGPAPAPAHPPSPLAPGAELSGAHPEALRFLLGVMNDEAAPLALRIEAAKALLAGGRSD